jgi:hypothetical protein
MADEAWSQPWDEAPLVTPPTGRGAPPPIYGDDGQRYISVAQLARALDVPAQTVRTWRDRDALTQVSDDDLPDALRGGREVWFDYDVAVRQLHGTGKITDQEHRHWL